VDNQGHDGGDHPPMDNSGDAPPAENPNGSTGDEVKLYVGNLDYGK
jgi:RNA recognition motif-containing protein